MRKFGHSREEATPSSSMKPPLIWMRTCVTQEDITEATVILASLHRIRRLWSCPSTLDKDDKGCDEVEWEDFSEGQ